MMPRSNASSARSRRALATRSYVLGGLTVRQYREHPDDPGAGDFGDFEGAPGQPGLILECVRRPEYVLLEAFVDRTRIRQDTLQQR